MMAQLEHGHCTARSTILAAPPAIVKGKSGEGTQTAVGLDPINEGVQPDVLQRGQAGMASQRSMSQDVTTATWNVSSMVSRSGEVVDALHRRRLISVVLRRRGGRVKVRGCLVLMVDDTSSFGKAVIRELLVLVCLLLRDRLSVLSMWSESIAKGNV